MMRSLYSGVSGLRTCQTKMDVIGNNISNVNTIGFKSSSVTFTDVLYQTTQSASGPTSTSAGTNAMQIGLGSTVGAITTNMTTAGSAERTDNAFDVMINGDAFFIVNYNGSNYFTKAGSFTTDANGTLCTSTGAKVQGYLADSDGNIMTGTLTDLDIMSSENLYTAPEATSNGYLTGNIDANDDTLVITTTTSGSTTTTSGGRTVELPIYDNKGNSYTVQLTIGISSDSDSEYTVTLADILDSDGESILSSSLTASLESGNIYFDTANGTFKCVGSSSSGTDTTLDLTIGGSGSDGSSTLFNTISIDFSALTNYSTGGTSTVDAKKGTSSTDSTGSGKAVGNMTGCSISTDGTIIGTYDNGDQKVLGQIAVATFTNPSGLEAVGNSMYAATLNSGDFDGVGTTISSIGGDFSTGVLEMSNVDLATEFTEMIVTQRAYQANSRIITVSDTMLEELINLKR